MANTAPGLAEPDVRPPYEKELFGHPVGLYVLFFTEMWERFCYYGMRAILRYYLVTTAFTDRGAHIVHGNEAVRGFFEKLHGPLDDKQFASELTGWYIAGSYATPVVGGWIADKFLGQRRSVVIGAIVMAAGQFLLMKDATFYPGILLLILGNGFFKPNISTQVGSLYKENDPRRDRAFGIFYVGINLGAFIAPFVCGTLGEKVGWGLGFGSAGVGLLVGLVIYLSGQKYLAPDNRMKEAARTKLVEDEKAGFRDAAKKEIADPPKATPFTRDEWEKMFALVVLCLLNTVFWGVYEQQSGTIADWALESTERHVFGWEVPASWFQAVNPFMIFALTPAINALWAAQYAKGKEPGSVTKMAIGCFLLAISFVFMVGGAHFGGETGKTNMSWLIVMFLFLTLGELYLSPVGLSLVTKVSPPRVLSLMMGMWFLSSCFGGYLSGYLGLYWTKMSKGNFFWMLSGLALVTGILTFALIVPLRRALNEHGDQKKEGEKESPEPT